MCRFVSPHPFHAFTAARKHTSAIARLVQDHFYSSRLEREIRFTRNYSFFGAGKVRTRAREIRRPWNSFIFSICRNKEESCLILLRSRSKYRVAHKLLESSWYWSTEKSGGGSFCGRSLLRGKISYAFLWGINWIGNDEGLAGEKYLVQPFFN